jgi:hypothetical protein
MMAISTAFPTMITKIITALGSASSLTGVRIFDGAEVDDSYPGDAIAIGHDGSIGDAEMQIATISDSPFAFTDLHEESGRINCSLWSWDGGTSLTARRTRAFTLLSAVDTVIRADPTFTGTALYSILETNSVNYRQTTMGAAVVINFTIAYQAQS